VSFINVIEDQNGNLTFLATIFDIISGQCSPFICRFNSDGNIYSDFGSDSYYDIQVSNIPISAPLKILQNGGRFLIGLYKRLESVNPNGTLDTNFNHTGMFTCDNFIFNDMKLQGTNKLILGGSSNGNFSLVRLNIPYEVSVKETPNTEINIFPNPTTGELRVVSSEYRVVSIEVFDVYGRVITSHYSLLTTHYSIDISHLQAGIYFVKINTEAGEVVKKIVKQ
jgi:hypothetical protein